MSTLVTGLALIVIGLLAMLGAVLNWRIVTHAGKIFNRLFGDTVARVIYFVAGVFLFIKGIEMMIGAHWLPI